MMKKDFSGGIFFLLLAVSFSLTACIKEDSCLHYDESPSAVLRVSVAPMRIEGQQVPYGHRASRPLVPEDENVLYSLAVLVFDAKEGVLANFYPQAGQGRIKPYKYINLKNEDGEGLMSTDLSTEGFPIVEGENYTVCLIANLSEEKLQALLQPMLDNDGTVFLNEFKNSSVAIPYVGNLTPGMDGYGHFEAGHVRDIYMFGYYQGNVSSYQEISITLGRIISRVELAFSIDETVKLDPDKTFYIRMENLESHAHLFPVGKSPGLYVVDSIHTVSDIEGMLETIYLYSAPNSALTADDALRLRMWYAEKGLSDEAVSALEANAVIHLGNDQPGIANRNYQLHRNSIYRFNINLTNKN